MVMTTEVVLPLAHGTETTDEKKAAPGPGSTVTLVSPGGRAVKVKVPVELVVVDAPVEATWTTAEERGEEVLEASTTTPEMVAVPDGGGGVPPPPDVEPPPPQPVRSATKAMISAMQAR
jgi:hypothetical protein